MLEDVKRGLAPALPSQSHIVLVAEIAKGVGVKRDPIPPPLRAGWHGQSRSAEALWSKLSAYVPSSLSD
ncbi:hypothetical protein GCM10007874_31470 [Labrys miyagiensis]|uniref:Uncharacterized protein n=1 Tax=Labrys miyagiensis TaxID=346912 RepID=A0ABQ6CJQ8_9HYPH|nr:hypothetical protein GCM10007874_31470 [Labrys miyagiensis]